MATMAGSDTNMTPVTEQSPPLQLTKSAEKLTPRPSRPHAPRRSSTMNGPLYMQSSDKKVNRSRVRRKDDGPLKNMTAWLFENQTGVSFNLVCLLFLTHVCMAVARPHTSKFFKLSYYNPRTGKYGAGVDDLYFMVFCTVTFTGLRAGVMEHILAPLARRWGVANRKDVTRFAEQSWMTIYYCLIWPLGMYIYYKSPYFLNMAELWTNWPDRELDSLVKVYILVQWSFWIQQVLVIHLEDRRKDHWQMLTHHFITISLIAASYANHQTKVGHLILILMDVVDLFFPIAKCLKYLGHNTLCDVCFGLFMISWFIARHVLYLMTCWSIYTQSQDIIRLGCYNGSMDNLEGPFPAPETGWSHILQQFYNPQGTVCYTRNVMYTFLSALLFLQGLTIMWFYMVVQVALRVLKGGSAEDTRSDDEDEAEEEANEVDYVPQVLVEVEAGVEDIDLKAWERRTGVPRVPGSSSISLPGHSDRKELLNRIGCEKQID